MGLLFIDGGLCTDSMFLKNRIEEKRLSTDKIRSSVRAESHIQCGFWVFRHKENESRHEKLYAKIFIHFR